MPNLLRGAPALAIGRTSTFIVLAASLQAGCATQQSTESGFLGDYGGLRSPPAEANLGSGQIKAQRPDRQLLARYDRLIVEPVTVSANDLDPEQAKALTTALSQSLASELGKGWAITDQPSPATLRVRVAVTKVTQASVPLNILTTTLIGPLSNGGAAGEAEILDAQTGQRLAALTWADQRRFSDIAGYYSATGHARGLMPYFAASIAKLISRQ